LGIGTRNYESDWHEIEIKGAKKNRIWAKEGLGTTGFEQKRGWQKQDLEKKGM